MRAPMSGMIDGEIARRLLDYLRAASDRPALAYAEAPAPLTGGFDAAVFRFRLDDAPAPFAGPLVLRLFPGRGAPDRARRESAVQNGLAALGYPAPRVFAATDDAAALGGAFLIMEHMAGRPLGTAFEGLRASSLGQAVALWSRLVRFRRDFLRLWGQAQVRLHELPVEPFLERLQNLGVAPKKLSFDTSVADMGAAAAEYRLDGLSGVIDWLAAERPRDAVAPVICHGDLQPFNVLVEDGRLTGIVDWVKTVVADPALDYGAVLAMLATVPIRAPPGLERPLRALMNHLANAHAQQFRAAHPGRESALRYYQVFNCVVQLITAARTRAAGKPHAYNSSAGIANLVRHIRRLTGASVHLPDS